MIKVLPNDNYYKIELEEEIKFETKPNLNQLRKKVHRNDSDFPPE